MKIFILIFFLIAVGVAESQLSSNKTNLKDDEFYSTNLLYNLSLYPSQMTYHFGGDIEDGKAWMVVSWKHSTNDYSATNAIIDMYQKPILTQISSNHWKIEFQK